MTVDGHPAELDLLAYAEGDLAHGAARDLEAHLAACPECAAAVEAQRSMRALLRAEPLLSLDVDEVRAVVRALPPRLQPTPWWRRRPAGRQLLVLAPAGGLAVAAAVAAVVVALPGGGGPAPTALQAPAAKESATGPAAGAAAGSDAAASAAAGARSAPATPEGTATAAYGSAGPAPAAAADGLPLLRAVAGQPEEVAARLRAAGLEVTVEDGSVVVRGADGERAREVLADVPAGPVRVVTR